MKRWLLPLLPLPLLLALGAWASAFVADRAAQAGADVLLSLAPLMREAPAAEADAALDIAIPTELALDRSGPTQGSLTAPTAKAPKRSAKARPSGPPVVSVSAEQVLGLAATRARPRGTPVPANAVRPAGLKLSGVAALGIGMHDGDILTRAVGQPALSSGAVIQAVLMARAQRAPVLEGEFWRGNERWVLRVAQPYVSERHSSSESAEGDPGVRLTMRESSPTFDAP